MFMLSKTNVSSVWIFLGGNNGVNWIASLGGSSSKRNLLWLHTWQITLVKGRWVSKIFLAFCKLAMRILTTFGLNTLLLRVCLFKYELHKVRAAICMTNENMYHCLRLAVITLEPKFKELAWSRKFHFSLQHNNN